MLLYLLNEQGEPAQVPLQEILYITASKSGPLFVAASGTYRQPHTVKQLCDMFQAYGYEQVDRHLIANLQQAAYFEPTERKLFFERQEQGDMSLYATVSSSNSWKLQHLIREDYSSYFWHSPREMWEISPIFLEFC
ncbi:LytTR family transcriptional regulator DNA-binding domain-containing protein [Paenibacillus sp. GCM10027626]|uniref:LytTR family transcriptional regulator DNA-binding domain-containing protein n=1 Tax=Paenibacillus sp. GCM10027626 TaxID=3273411 RepID=UPI0036363A95